MKKKFKLNVGGKLGIKYIKNYHDRVRNLRENAVTGNAFDKVYLLFYKNHRPLRLVIHLHAFRFHVSECGMRLG